MTNKEYFMQEMKMTDEQLERLWKFYQENVVCKDFEVIAPMKSFLVEYQFSSIGTAKIAKFNDTSFWIDEEESNP
tara:strand:+ start:9110 stop:9334 length:225 start_codon:yes stop_codon:yes gene_type:complete